MQQVIAQDEAQLQSLAGKEKESYRELQDRWKEAVETLQRSYLRKHGNPLYVLPWYLVIGESGSGKTTAIESARLSSPFAEFPADFRPRRHPKLRLVVFRAGGHPGHGGPVCHPGG